MTALPGRDEAFDFSRLVERAYAWAGSLSPAAWRRIDWLTAAVLFVGLTGPVLLGVPEEVWGTSEPSPIGIPRPVLNNVEAPLATIGIGAGTALAVAFRRRWPLPALAAATLLTAAAQIWAVRFTPFGSNAGPAVGLAMYTVVTGSPRRNAQYLPLVVFVLMLAASGWVSMARHDIEQNAVHEVAAVAGWATGEAVLARRRYRAELADRRRAEDEERTRRLLAEQRLQLSREIHDVVSHNLTVIAVQSAVGRMVFDSRPAEARTALVDVERVSRAALDELRRLLSQTRTEGAAEPDKAVAPPPGLDHLPALMEEVAGAGVGVTVACEVSPEQRRPWPATLELSVYRIVQEALTNVVRHAAPASARVLVADRPATASRAEGQREVLIEVTDEPSDRQQEPAAAAPPGSGWGLAGIRERAALYGGSMQAGPTATGFRVAVRIPLSDADADADAGAVDPGEAR